MFQNSYHHVSSVRRVQTSGLMDFNLVIRVMAVNAAGFV